MAVSLVQRHLQRVRWRWVISPKFRLYNTTKVLFCTAAVGSTLRRSGRIFFCGKLKIQTSDRRLRTCGSSTTDLGHGTERIPTCRLPGLRSVTREGASSNWPTTTRKNQSSDALRQRAATPRARGTRNASLGTEPRLRYHGSFHWPVVTLPPTSMGGTVR